MKTKKIVIMILILVIFIIIFSLFNFFNYKKLKTVNNISDKTLQEIERYIIGINSYNATIELNVESNKNSNKYIIKQKYCAPNLCEQVIEEPKNIEGLTIVYDGTNMKISNTKLSLTTIYENYQYISDNVLWLSDFIENYKANGGRISEQNDGIIVMETKTGKNKYSSTEKLYIDRNANKITKLIIEDENNKAKIYITYKETEINSLNPEDVI